MVASQATVVSDIAQESYAPPHSFSTGFVAAAAVAAAPSAVGAAVGLAAPTIPAAADPLTDFA
jgi:hypothetical protein